MDHKGQSKLANLWAENDIYDGFGSLEDRVNKIMKGIDSISDKVTDRLPSTGIFEKKGDGEPSSIASLVGGCESNVLRCGPPKIELFGGTPGVGGLANAVVKSTDPPELAVPDTTRKAL